MTEFELIIDSYEQNIERPQDYYEQKKYYSGKKKSHTLKNQLIILPKGQDIVDVTVGDPGPRSDLNIFRESQKIFEPNQNFQGDKAYVGESSIKTPYKKKKNQQLTSEEKEENKKLSRSRIFVEHVIRLVKIFRIAQERFRLNKQKYAQIIGVICGLVRLRIGALILPL